MAAPASYSRRSFVGNAAATTVPLGLGSGDGSCTIASATNWPSGSGGAFLVVIDRGQNTEELAWSSGVSGTTLTFALRGAQGTSGVAHAAGCTIALSMGQQDLDEANQVVAGVLGQSGAAKGDILYMLSAAGPNTLQRLAVGTNGSLLSAASAVPAYTAAGTSGQLLQSAGSSVPTWNSTLLQGIATSALGSGTSTADSFAALSSVSATVTVTTGTKALVILSWSAMSNSVGGNDYAYMGVAVSGATTIAASKTFWANTGGTFSQAGSLILPYGTGGGGPGALTAGSNVFTVGAGVGGGGTGTFTNVLLTVIPIN